MPFRALVKKFNQTVIYIITKVINMYKILQELESINLFDKLVKQGVLPITLVGHKMIYEIYLRELKKAKKSQAITNTSIETKTPERTVYRIIEKMELK